MYKEFYKLDDHPFRTLSDPSFLFWSEQHAMAFAMLRYGVQTRAPLTLITGAVGAGKTTLLRQLLVELSDDLVVGLVSNMMPGGDDLLTWIMSALGVEPGDASPVATLRLFESFVIQRFAEGKRVVLIFDEAQNLDVKTLEQLRMLTNINVDSEELLQLILVGQPQLRDLVNRPELTQFAQRIVSDFHLEALKTEEVETYILHRLEKVGAQWRIFTPEACALVAKATGGVPRLVNILCDLALVYGYAAEQHVVDHTLLHEFLSSAKRHGIYRQFIDVTNIEPLAVRRAQ